MATPCQYDKLNYHMTNYHKLLRWLFETRSRYVHHSWMTNESGTAKVKARSWKWCTVHHCSGGGASKILGVRKQGRMRETVRRRCPPQAVGMRG